MADDDLHLDAELRRVPMPADLQAAVSPEALFADASTNRMLAELAVPSGLADRVRTAVQSRAAGGSRGVVDLSRFAAAGETGLPPRRRLPAGGWLRAAREAASVAAALGLAVLVSLAGIEVSRQMEGAANHRVAVSLQTPRGEPGSAAISVDRSMAVTIHAEPAAIPITEGDRVAAIPDLPHRESRPEFRPHPESPAETARPGAAAGAPETIRGAPVWFDDRPVPATMSTVALPSGARRAVPRSSAFDLAFELTHGEAPFVDPAADPSLAVDRPPLTLRTDGFDELLGRETARRVPGSRVRVEEVLAAMPPPPELAAADGPAVRLGLHAVRTRREIGGKPSMLLEAVVFAAGDRPAAGPPRKATLIIDQSAAGDPRTWPRICRGVAALAGRLEPADRITVVICGPRPRVAVRDADPRALVDAATNWEALPATAAADLDAAFELVAAEKLGEPLTVVVAHAVTLERGRSAVRTALADWHAALASAGGDPVASLPGRGPRFVVIDPTAAADPHRGEPTFGRTAADAAAVRRELVRQVTGRDTLVAEQCRLEVRFTPSRVLRYRIVGYRQSAVESLAAAAPAAIDLHAGDTVRVVYEVVPRDGATLGLARAVLTWRPPGEAVARLEAEDRDPRDRGAGLPSPRGCELLLATGLGELAGGSPHRPQPRAMVTRLDELAGAWRVRGDLTPFGAALVGAVERRPIDHGTGR